MLSTLRKAIVEIGYDAKNQTPEILESNMKIIEGHVRDILKLDGVGLMRIDSKVNDDTVIVFSDHTITVAERIEDILGLI